MVSNDISEKAEELYSVIIEKLYKHYVVDKSEMTVGTAVQIISALKVLPTEKKMQAKLQNFEEEDSI